jgi:hypothetical protein
MRRPHIPILIAVFLSIAVTASVAVALPTSGVHFNKKETTAARQGDNLVVSFKLSGLGDISSVDVTVTADAACINGGGKNPKAANKVEVSGGGTFAVQNGSSEGTITVSPAGKPELNCGTGQSLQYSNVVISGGGATLSIPGTF